MRTYSRIVSPSELKTDSSGRVNAVFATANVALDEHRLLPGCFVKNWKGRGETGLTGYESIGCPLLRAHALDENAVGKVENLRETGDGRLMGAAVFAPTVTGQELATLYESGFQSSFSVSWIPVEYSYSTDKTRGPGAIDFKLAKLLEISCVSIPSDMGATVQRARGGDLRGAAMSLGIKLAISDIEPRIAEIAIREASRMLSADNYARSIADRATFFAIAHDHFSKLGGRTK